jgi:hypothetical protein
MPSESNPMIVTLHCGQVMLATESKRFSNGKLVRKYFQHTVQENSPENETVLILCFMQQWSQELEILIMTDLIISETKKRIWKLLFSIG